MSQMSGPEDLKRNRPVLCIQETHRVVGKRPSESKGLCNMMHRALEASNQMMETKDKPHPGIKVGHSLLQQ